MGDRWHRSLIPMSRRHCWGLQRLLWLVLAEMGIHDYQQTEIGVIYGYMINIMTTFLKGDNIILIWYLHHRVIILNVSCGSYDVWCVRIFSDLIQGVVESKFFHMKLVVVEMSCWAWLPVAAVFLIKGKHWGLFTEKRFAKPAFNLWHG